MKMPNIVETILNLAVERKCSDIHITVGVPPMGRIDGQLTPFDGYDRLTNDQTKSLAYSMVNEDQLKRLEQNGEVDFSYSISNLGRFRVNIFRQRGSFSVVLRVLSSKIPTIDELGLPLVLKDLALKPRGLILVTGPTGSGKSTTLASIIDYINNNRRGHILTLEDPIEYLHKHNRCIVNQREVGDDSKSFASGLRSALREDPDVILVGEMRDLETISIAVSAAETGHLVLSTLHTVNAAQTVDRIIDMYPSNQQQQIKVQLAGVLQGVISQQLLRVQGGHGRVAAFEILLFSDGMRNIIREGKTQQIPSMMQTAFSQGMMTMDYSLAQHVKKGNIILQDALLHCTDSEMLKRYLG
ncbi:MAG: type IV pilus twitching motility protein PilT [Oscillospiraceae bacterium]|nr:type IV pilus twitching motility protein PilT [Oscillospiraceae bacterium]MDD4545905.1 type IV pilus twitching motility protein PilT [Oscillospiraceae bacterium]